MIIAIFVSLMLLFISLCLDWGQKHRHEAVNGKVLWVSRRSFSASLVVLALALANRVLGNSGT